MAGYTPVDCSCRAMGQPVPAIGDQRSDIMIVRGLVLNDTTQLKTMFSDPEGKILRDVLLSLSVRVGDVYTTHAIKCFIELDQRLLNLVFASCAQNLRDELSIVDPRVVIALSNIASRMVQLVECDTYEQLKEGDIRIVNDRWLYVLPTLRSLIGYDGKPSEPYVYEFRERMREAIWANI